MSMTPKQLRWFFAHLKEQSAARDRQEAEADERYPESPLFERAKPTGNRVVVSLSEKKAQVESPEGVTLKRYPVYVGSKEMPTPAGEFRVMEKRRQIFRNREHGGHWIGFAWDYGKKNDPKVAPYAGFHGWRTTKDDLEYEKENPGWLTSTQGCVQMGNKDVHDLSRVVGAGDRVSVSEAPLDRSKPSLTPIEYRRYRRAGQAGTAGRAASRAGLVLGPIGAVAAAGEPMINRYERLRKQAILRARLK